MRALRLVDQPELGIIPMPDETVSVELQAGIEATIPVPDGAKLVHFASGAEFFATDSGTAFVPTATPTVGTQERNPALRTIEYGTTQISCIAHIKGHLTVAFYG